MNANNTQDTDDGVAYDNDYVDDHRFGPTNVFICTDCGHHCRKGRLNTGGWLYTCSGCGERWNSKGLAPYKVEKHKIND